MIKITVKEKNGESRNIDLEKHEVTIGRVKGNDIVLPKGNVSKRHSRIVSKDGKLIIVDLKSTNGTYVNGRKITSPQPVLDTDKIYVGDFVLSVKEFMGAPSGPPPPIPTSLPAGPLNAQALGAGPPSAPPAPPRPGSGPPGPTGLLSSPASRGPGASNNLISPPSGSGLGNLPGPASPHSSNLSPMSGGLGGSVPVRSSNSNLGPPPGGNFGQPTTPGLGGSGNFGASGSKSGLPASGGFGAPPIKSLTTPTGGLPGRSLNTPSSLVSPPSDGLSAAPGHPDPISDSVSPGKSGFPISGSPSFGLGKSNIPAPSSEYKDTLQQPIVAPDSTPFTPMSKSNSFTEPVKAKASEKPVELFKKKEEREPVSVEGPGIRSLGLKRIPRALKQKRQLTSRQTERSQALMNAKELLLERFMEVTDPRSIPSTYPGPDTEPLERAIQELVEQLTSEFDPNVDLNMLTDLAIAEVVGFGPIEYYLNEKNITEIYVNSASQIILGSKGHQEEAEYGFSNVDFLFLTAQRLLNNLGLGDDLPPMVEMRLMDGTRVNVVLPPASTSGPVIILRKPISDFQALEESVNEGILSNDMVTFFQVAVNAEQSFLISGPPGSGKTFILNALAGQIPHTERIVTVEDVAQLSLPQASVVSLESYPPTVDIPEGITLHEVLKHALRMKPDRIVFDGCHGSEAYDWVTSVATGFPGSMFALSGHSCLDVLHRLESLSLIGNGRIPLRALRSQIVRGIDFIIQLEYNTEGTLCVGSISELTGLDFDQYNIQEVFYRASDLSKEKKFVATGYIPLFYDHLKAMGQPVDTHIFGT